MGGCGGGVGLWEGGVFDHELLDLEVGLVQRGVKRVGLLAARVLDGIGNAYGENHGAESDEDVCYGKNFFVRSRKKVPHVHWTLQDSKQMKVVRKIREHRVNSTIVASHLLDLTIAVLKPNLQARLCDRFCQLIL